MLCAQIEGIADYTTIPWYSRIKALVNSNIPKSVVKFAENSFRGDDWIRHAESENYIVVSSRRGPAKCLEASPTN